jgi:GT2 family glycosyltransferase
MRIAILLTCYNRIDLTMKCLKFLDNLETDSMILEVYVVDGGSSDHTAASIIAKYPSVDIQIVDECYWNEGMRLAWTKAFSVHNYDGYLWLNDDVELLPNFFTDIFETSQRYSHESVVVGYTVDPDTNVMTYGGLVRKSKFSRLNFRLNVNGIECDTFNGNCVFIPKNVFKKVGINAINFRHSMGDIDYGLRSRNFRFKIIQTSEPIGYCKLNTKWISQNSRLNWKTAKFIFFHPKGIPIKEWFYFCRTHGGIFWPINFLFRYLKLLHG